MTKKQQQQQQRNFEIQTFKFIDKEVKMFGLKVRITRLKVEIL